MDELPKVGEHETICPFPEVAGVAEDRFACCVNF